MNFNKSIYIALTFSILTHSTSFASTNSEELKNSLNQLSSCGNFVRFDEQYLYTGFGKYWTGPQVPREPKPALLKIKSTYTQKEINIDTRDSVIDLISDADNFYVLTFSSLEIWDKHRLSRISSHLTHTLSRDLEDEEHPRALTKADNKIFIAHGRLGVSVFDLTRKKIIQEIPINDSQAPLESVVNGIAASGDLIIAAADSYTLVEQDQKAPFRGLLTISAKSNQVLNRMDGMDPGVDSIVADDKVAIASFYGQPLLKYSVHQLKNSHRLPMPIKRIWKFPGDGRPSGKASIDGKYYYTCYLRLPNPGEGSRYIRETRALDRKILILD